MPTRSPGLRPVSRSAFATWFDAALSSAYVILKSSRIIATLSGFFLALSSRITARFRLMFCPPRVQFRPVFPGAFGRFNLALGHPATIVRPPAPGEVEALPEA